MSRGSRLLLAIIHVNSVLLWDVRNPVYETKCPHYLFLAYE